MRLKRSDFQRTSKLRLTNTDVVFGGQGVEDVVNSISICLDMWLDKKLNRGKKRLTVLGTSMRPNNRWHRTQPLLGNSSHSGILNLSLQKSRYPQWRQVAGGGWSAKKWKGRVVKSECVGSVFHVVIDEVYLGWGQDLECWRSLLKLPLEYGE